MQDSFDILVEIREFLISENDKVELDHQLSSFDVVPLAQIIQSMQMQRQKENEPGSACHQTEKVAAADCVMVKTEQDDTDVVEVVPED